VFPFAVLRFDAQRTLIPAPCFRRLVHHIDEGARAALTQHYSEVLEPGMRVLDLASSWVSHLPPTVKLKLGDVTALGMNEAELKENSQINRYVVQDLNKEPALPFPDASFDAVICAVSIDYMTRPREVLAEVARVLDKEGLAVMAFSNRCFPSKVIKIWLDSGDAQHMQIVGMFYHFASPQDEERLFEAPEAFSLVKAKRSDPMFVVQARRKAA
jgi:ubiquinone/menaquinone biosynthesis C-methylase UbiE